MIKTEKYGFFNLRKRFIVYISKEYGVEFKNWEHAKIYELLLKQNPDNSDTTKEENNGI